jgi:hypothetical protein
LLGVARNHHPCAPLIPSRLLTATAWLSAFDFPYHPPPLAAHQLRSTEALHFRRFNSRRSPPHRWFATLRWPPRQDKGWLGAKARDCGMMLRDDDEPRNGDCRLIVGAALAFAWGDNRRVGLRTGPSSWHEPLRTSATAGKAPNARHYRARATALRSTT